MLDDIDVAAVEDPTLGHLLRAKHREMELQLEMLEARESDDFLPLSIELYGGVSPALRRQAEALLDHRDRDRAAGRRRSTPRSSSRWPRPRSTTTARSTRTSRCTPRSGRTSTA